MENNVTLETHNLSHSKLSTYINCPWKYKLKYVDKNYINMPNLNLIFGTATHQILQEWLTVIYSKKEKDGMKIKFDTRFTEILKEEMSKAAEKVGGSLSSYFSKEETLEFLNQTVNLIYKIRTKRKQYFALKSHSLIGTEVPLSCEYTYNGKSILFNGFIDLIIKNNNTGKYTIYDLKTSKNGWNDLKKKDTTVTSQLVLYKYFYSKQYNIPIEDIDICFFIMKRQPYVSEDFPTHYVTKFSPASGNVSTNKALKLINNYIQEVLIDAEQKFNKINKYCNWCEYNNPSTCSTDNRLNIIDLHKQSIFNKSSK
jgi:ATP-dependent helicase/DNAse subunit B